MSCLPSQKCAADPKEAVAGLNSLFLFKNNLSTIIVLGEDPRQRVHSDLCHTAVLAVCDPE